MVWFLFGILRQVRRYGFTSIGFNFICRTFAALDLATRIAHDRSVTSGGRGVELLISQTYTDIIDNGWLFGYNGELVMWLPHEYRSCFGMFPKIKTLGRPDAIADFRGYTAHGTEWIKCYSPRF